MTTLTSSTKVKGEEINVREDALKIDNSAKILLIGPRKFL